MMEPVAWTSAAQLQRMKEQPSHNHRMWGEPLPYHDDIPLVRLSDAEARIAELEAELETLRGWVDPSVTELTSIKALTARAEAAEALANDYVLKSEAWDGCQKSAQRARDKALEEAAKVAEKSGRAEDIQLGNENAIAASIRKLKEKP